MEFVQVDNSSQVIFFSPTSYNASILKKFQSFITSIYLEGNQVMDVHYSCR